MSDDERVNKGDAGRGDEPDVGRVGSGPAETPDDALRSLERLEALSQGEKPSVPAAAPRPSRRPRLRVATASRPAETWARIAAPVAFLVAVIVVVSLAFQSGVVGGDERAKKADTPAPKASKTASKSPKPSAKPTATTETRSYTVKPGDTLSGIASRFGTTVARVEELNADADLTTLQPGQKITVPAQ